MSPKPLLILNDDGVDAKGLGALVRALQKAGHPLLVLVPAKEQSATSMKITLQSGLKFDERNDMLEAWGLDPDGPAIRIFTLDGSPCDCAIVALEGGMEAWAPEIQPVAAISGINRGPNLSIDVFHSGTVSAAREAALYGMPALACSLSTYLHEDYEAAMPQLMQTIDAFLDRVCGTMPERSRPRGVGRPLWKDLSLPMDERLRDALCRGDILVNVNTPAEPSGEIRTTTLGARWYRSATDMRDVENLGVAYEVGSARIEDEPIPGTDCLAVAEGATSVNILSSWPHGHPLCISDEMLAAANVQGADGLPSFLCE